MSLNFNNIASAKPVIREAANMNNDGGGGNLGYMQQGEREDKKHKQNESIFATGLDHDVFGVEKELYVPDEGFSLSKLIAKIIDAVKQLFK